MLKQNVELLPVKTRFSSALHWSTVPFDLSIEHCVTAADQHFQKGSGIVASVSMQTHHSLLILYMCSLYTWDNPNPQACSVQARHELHSAVLLNADHMVLAQQISFQSYTGRNIILLRVI